MPSLRVNGYDLSYAEAGKGSPLILIHGTLGDQRSFAAQMTTLAARYRVIALSLRHCWPDRWEEGGDFTIARHVADVAAFIRALDQGPVRLLGHSRGGHIAFRVAERHPELVRALVLVEPGGDIDESLGNALPGTGRQAFAEAAAMIAAGDEEGAIRRVALHTGGTEGWDERPEARRTISRDNARTLLGQMHEQREPYTRAAAEAIQAPTLLLNGENTQPIFLAIIAALKPHLRKVRHVVIKDAAHELPDENPSLFNAAVLTFLAMN